MADIINAPDLPSEDEDDTDYDPSRQGLYYNSLTADVVCHLVIPI